jgi:alanyl aminopeptidase
MFAIVFCIPVFAAFSQTPAPPVLRLPANARPTHYAVDLKIDPAQDSFRGTIKIDLDLLKSSSYIWLNAHEIIIEGTTVRANGFSGEVSQIPGNEDFIGFAFGRELAAGKTALEIKYRGTLSKTSMVGLFRQKDGDDWYVFSQFEPTEARRAFPCFDEPAYKVPWQLTIHAPKGNSVVSNTRIVSETDGENGFRDVRFAETKPLPSYLVAFGVGPFDFVDAGKACKNKIPLRIVTMRGKSARARYASEATAPLLNLLEEYFGIPYPYEKLDLMSVPQGAIFGAMENAGLITFIEQWILATPQEDTPSFKRNYARIATHEMAHMWVGDLVTMAWWDDTWLNESFATWMEDKILQRWKPEWQRDVAHVERRDGSADQDNLVSARRIRQPIESKDDITNAFDEISYGKGSAILTMFESWIGEKKFQGAVRKYLTAHSFGNATSQDFLHALAAEGPPGIAAAFSTFLDQTGVPRVTADLRCQAAATPTLTLSQQRFLPMGSKGSAAQVWQIPICIRFTANGKESRACTLMTTPQQEIPLKDAAGCPDWILVNDHMAGYYRTIYQGDLLPKLLDRAAAHLTLAEKVGVLWDVSALARQGAMPADDALGLVPRFAKDSNRQIVSAAAGIATLLQKDYLPEELWQDRTRFIRSMFSGRAQAIGILPKPGESEDTSLLRQSLLYQAVLNGEDPELGKQAVVLARRWLADRKEVSPDVIDTILTAAVQAGGKDLFDALKGEIPRAAERADRQRLYAALGSSQNPEWTKSALPMILDPSTDAMETISLLGAAISQPETAQTTWDFFRQNFDAVVARLPEEIRGQVPNIASVFCDPQHRAEAAEFFGTRAQKMTGAPRVLAQVLERIDVCIDTKATLGPRLAAFLKKF